jgi:hypothetical protein
MYRNLYAHAEYCGRLDKHLLKCFIRVVCTVCRDRILAVGMYGCAARVVSPSQCITLQCPSHIAHMFSTQFILLYLFIVKPNT